MIEHKAVQNNHGFDVTPFDTSTFEHILHLSEEFWIELGGRLLQISLYKVMYEIAIRQPSGREDMIQGCFEPIEMDAVPGFGVQDAVVRR